jgi:hypothetical protein
VLFGCSLLGGRHPEKRCGVAYLAFPVQERPGFRLNLFITLEFLSKTNSPCFLDVPTKAEETNRAFWFSGAFDSDDLVSK